MRRLTADRIPVRIFAAFVLLAGLCLLGACARKVRVEINALAEHGEARAAGKLAGKRCLVLPAKPDVSQDDLQFREFSAQVSASLAQKGCTPARGLEDADLAALLHYGVGEPFLVEERGYVVYRPWGRWGRGMADYIPVTTTYVFHASSLSLEARLVEKAGAPPAGTKKGGIPSGPKSAEGGKLGSQLWKGEATLTGQRADLRAVFPWLLAAAKEYYGTDSGHNILVGVGAEDLLSDPPAAQNIASSPGADAP
jgi:hypothetical protein